MTDLKTLFHTHKGKVSEKWEHNLEAYETAFQPRRKTPLRLLEIGVQNGGSLEVWGRYFPKKEILVGCDIREACGRLTYKDRHTHVVVGDSTKPDVTRRILELSKSFNLIIDDGSHLSGEIIKNLVLYFPHLEEGGIYVIEDLHCSYWGEYQGGIFHPASSIAFLQRLTDLLNHEHWGVPRPAEGILRGFEVALGITIPPGTFTGLRSIRFTNSMCFIEKSDPKSVLLGTRRIAGTVEGVVPGRRKFKGKRLEVIPQAQNAWSLMDRAPADLFEKIQAEQLRTHRAFQFTQEQLDLILRSRSWKMIMRFQRAGQQLKRVVWGPVRFIEHVKREGARAVFGKITRLLRQEGVLGILRWVGIRNPAHHSYPLGDYGRWLRLYEPPTRPRHGNPDRVRVSVLLPTYNSRPDWLMAAIDSVRLQSFVEWELCIVDDASDDPATLAFLEHVTSIDPRIRFKRRAENGHISLATNDALAMARGEWLALLDHDDVLSHDALATMVQWVDAHPGCRVAYSDEDKIAPDGSRVQPFFKTDFDPDLFLGVNMVCHLGFYQKKLVESVGGFRVNYEGAQDYDLALRCFERIGPGGFVHVPRILYHWRIHPASTAGDDLDAKPYAKNAQYRALKDYFNRQCIPVYIKPISTGFQLQYSIPNLPPMVSLLLATHGGSPFLSTCVSSILEKTAYPNFEILIIDGDPDEGRTLRCLDGLKSNPRVRILREAGPFGFAALHNRAVKESKGSLLGLIRHDVEVIDALWLDEMVSHAIRPGIGAVGAKLLTPAHTIHHAGLTLGMDGVAGHPFRDLGRDSRGYFGRIQLVCGYSAVSDGCLVIQKKTYEAVGGLDETHLKADFQAVDFCLRVREAGYRNLYTPWAELVQHGPVNRGREDASEKRASSGSDAEYMKRRWGEKLTRDPYYNPNLSQAGEPFTLAWPPRES